MEKEKMKRSTKRFFDWDEQTRLEDGAKVSTVKFKSSKPNMKKWLVWDREENKMYSYGDNIDINGDSFVVNENLDVSGNERFNKFSRYNWIVIINGVEYSADFANSLNDKLVTILDTVEKLDENISNVYVDISKSGSGLETRYDARVKKVE